MSYRALVNGNIRKAFNLIKDLAIDVTFNTRTVGDFDFATGTPVSDKTSSVVVQAVVEKNDKPKNSRLSANEGRNFPQIQIMFKKQDLGDISLYDTVDIEGTRYQVGKPIKNDGYIVILQVLGEG